MESIVREADRELAALLDACCTNGGGRTAIVHGPAGIGKSTVLAALRRRAAAAGMTVLAGSASVADRARPCGPLLDALGLAPMFGLESNGSLGDSRSAEQPGAGASKGELTDRRSPFQDAPQHRTVLLDLVADAAETAAGDRPVLLTIDDLQWADPLTVAGLLAIERVCHQLPLLMVVALRPLPTDEELISFVETVRSRGAAHVELGGFDDEEVAAAATRILGARPQFDLSTFTAGAGGNPFLLTELVREMVRTGAVVVRGRRAELADPAAPWTPPESLSRQIAHRMASLPDEAADVLRIAAVLGRAFTPDELRSVTGRSMIDLVGSIDAAVRSGLLHDDGHRLQFRHDLVHEAVLATVPSSVLAAMHCEIARQLAAAGAPASRVAHHHLAGAQRGDTEAVRWLRAAAAGAASLTPTVAADLLQAALGLLSPLDPSGDEITAELVDALMWSGGLSRASDYAEPVLARLPPGPLANRLHESMARLRLLQGNPAEAVRHADAQTSDPDSPGWTTAMSGVFRVFALDLDGALSCSDDALAMAQRSSDDWTEVLANLVAVWVANARGFHDLAARHGAAAVAAAERSVDRGIFRLIPHVFHALAIEGTGRSEDARHCLGRGAELSDELGTAWATPFFHYLRGVTFWNGGNWDELLAECDAGLRYAADHQIGLCAGWACAVSAGAHLYRGEVEQAGLLLDAGDAHFAKGGLQFGLDWLMWIRSLHLEAQGKRADALALLTMAWETASGIQADSALLIFAGDLARLAWLEGDRALVERCASALDVPGETWGRVRIDASIDRLAGFATRQPRRMLDAVGAHDRIGRPVQAALDWELIALARAEAGDLTGAADAAEECLRRCAAQQLALVENRLRLAAAEHGVVLEQRRDQRRAVRGWDALTATERRIADLIGDGMSNRQIADVLFISRRTVESHLYRVFAKLGAQNRTQVALAATARR